MATTNQPTTSEPTSLSFEEDGDLSPTDEAVSRCLDEHTLALLRVLASAGDAWGASPEEQRLVSGLVGAESPRSAS